MSTTAGLQALTFNQLPDINEVEPFSVEDQDCLDELHAVLKRHGRVEKFGIILLHNHFHLEEDEVLVERYDAQKRTLLSRPAHLATLDLAHLRETVWRFDGPAGQRCPQYCPEDESGTHLGYKDHEGEPVDDDEDE